MKDKVLEELQFSVGIVLGGEEVVPRFRVISPDGEWTIFVPLPEDIGERQRRMQLVYGFMAWKSAVAFVMSSELKEPDCVIAGAVSRDCVLLAARPIVRKPLTVGPIEWLPESAVGEEVIADIGGLGVCIIRIEQLYHRVPTYVGRGCEQGRSDSVVWSGCGARRLASCTDRSESS